jgi:hypothetical protein
MAGQHDARIDDAASALAALCDVMRERSSGAGSVQANTGYIDELARLADYLYSLNVPPSSPAERDVAVGEHRTSMRNTLQV